MTYPKNTIDSADLPDRYYDAKRRMSEVEREVYELREQIIATGESILVGQKYRVTVDKAVTKRLDRDRLRLFMSDRMIEDCMEAKPCTFVRLKTIFGKAVNIGRGKGRYRPRDSQDED
jgi:hypothetical protein